MRGLVKSILIVGMFTMLLALGTAYAQNRSRENLHAQAHPAPYAILARCASGDPVALERCRAWAQP